MEKTLEDYLSFLSSASVPFEISPNLRRESDFRGDLRPSARLRHHRLDGVPELAEELDADLSIGADHATLSVAAVLHEMNGALDGRKFVELGCGSGLISLIAAHHGASVLATDVDDEALAIARRNADRNGLEIEFARGSLLDPLPPEVSYDWFVANLPHKPGDVSEGLPVAQAGGPDGAALYDAAFDAMAQRQKPGGHVLFFLHSLPHPRLLRRAARHYTLTLLSWKLRWLGPGEYAPILERFDERAATGHSFLHREGESRALVCGVWHAQRRKGGDHVD